MFATPIHYDDHTFGYVRLVTFSQHAAPDMGKALAQLKVRVSGRGRGVADVEVACRPEEVRWAGWGDGGTCLLRAEHPAPTMPCCSATAWRASSSTSATMAAGW